MGLDFIEIVMALEARYCVRIDDDVWQSRTSPQRGHDLSVRDLVEVVLESERCCGKCGYSLRGLGPAGRCPECGRGFVVLAEPDVFDGVVQTLRDALQIRTKPITADSLLVRDLGMS